MVNQKLIKQLRLVEKKLTEAEKAFDVTRDKATSRDQLWMARIDLIASVRKFLKT